MAQRNSGYERVEADFYPTPAWVTDALVEHGLDDFDLENLRVWEPACGDNAMVNALKAWGIKTWGTDIRGVPSRDFLDENTVAPRRDVNGIITNPPYKKQLIEAFIRRSLKLMEPEGGMVAMLMRVDFDSGITRGDMFEHCPAWSKKLVLNKRIKWFDTGNPNGPSDNHAWFIWDWQHRGAPTIAYGY